MLLTGLFPIASSASSLIEPRAISPGISPPIMDWTLPHQSVRKKRPYNLALHFSLMEAFFFDSGSLLFRDSSFCQVDITLASTQYLMQLINMLSVFLRYNGLSQELKSCSGPEPQQQTVALTMAFGSRLLSLLLSNFLPVVNNGCLKGQR